MPPKYFLLSKEAISLITVNYITLIKKNTQPALKRRFHDPKNRLIVFIDLETNMKKYYNYYQRKKGCGEN